jgi:hypothetical protein
MLVVRKGSFLDYCQMFPVDVGAAAAIRLAYDLNGEPGALAATRRWFPEIVDDETARLCARTIAGWRPFGIGRYARRCSLSVTRRSQSPRGSSTNSPRRRYIPSRARHRPGAGGIALRLHQVLTNLQEITGGWRSKATTSRRSPKPRHWLSIKERPDQPLAQLALVSWMVTRALLLGAPAFAAGGIVVRLDAVNAARRRYFIGVLHL